MVGVGNSHPQQTWDSLTVFFGTAVTGDVKGTERLKTEGKDMGTSIPCVP